MSANGSVRSKRSSRSRRGAQRAGIVIPFTFAATQLCRSCQRQELREDEAFASAFGLLRRSRRVGGLVRFSERTVSPSLGQRRRQRIGRRGVEQSRQILLYHHRDLSAGQFFGGPINRYELAAIGLTLAKHGVVRNADDGSGEHSLDATADKKSHAFVKAAVNIAVATNPFRDEWMPRVVS